MALDEAQKEALQAMVKQAVDLIPYGDSYTCIPGGYFRLKLTPKGMFIERERWPEPHEPWPEKDPVWRKSSVATKYYKSLLAEQSNHIDLLIKQAQLLGITTMQWLMSGEGFELHIDAGYSFTGANLTECLLKAIEFGEELHQKKNT
jgi:hypothetical protein